ncbi:hypothetical protein DPMN_083806 [Dreissena polymorpha]|uniref:Uncharacterized protein n=1 Tax=Dreissena polymorpha TaxID=45954 RepID=A0A9D3Y9G5_DREPO|nr:hypothetical protein DPMN_083806 [Dreissena polymorpha]
MDREALGKWSCISRVEDRVDREAIVTTITIWSCEDLVAIDRGPLGRAEIAKGSRIGRGDRAEMVELGRVWSGNFSDRDDRVDQIGSGNPP